MYGIIYYALNILNNKRYIGQTVRALEKRKYFHIYESKHKRLDYHFYRAIREYGENSFIWGVLEETETREKLLEREIYWIAFYDTTNIDKGYNMTNGGDNYGIPTLEVRKRMGRCMIGKKNPFYGRRHSLATLKRISKTKKERKCGVKSVFCIETQEVFPSIDKAAIKYGVHASNICMACKRKIKTSGGFHWEYYKENKD